MSLPNPLLRHRTDRLAALEAAAGREGVTTRRGRRAVQRARSLLRRAAHHARLFVDNLGGRAAAEQALQGVAFLEQTVASLEQGSVRSEIDRGQIDSAMVNQELLKSEVRALDSRLQHLGTAIAGGAGLTGAADAIAEMRERVTLVERRLRLLASQEARGDDWMAPGGTAPVPVSQAASQPRATEPHVDVSRTDAPRSTLFDYVGFERRFRGKPADVLATLEDRYGVLLAANPPVLDVGCGRGELLTLLGDKGISAVGVDTDPTMVADAISRGLKVHQADVVAFLRSQPKATYGSIIATHVAEHLSLDALIEMLELSATRLRPDGLLIVETPNPASLIVLGNSYILDPTHVWPLHPKLMAFLCEGAGFRNIELRFFAPATGFHLSRVTDPEAPPWVAQINAAFDQLNHVLFGPQDYAVVATTPPA
jgi:2-polyprenyl-3-methyl-5-hydroxy-6-metoxy-1,4-benzoquinol methylase